MFLSQLSNYMFKSKKQNNLYLLDETVEVAADLTRWSRELIKIQDFKNRVVCNSLSCKMM